MALNKQIQIYSLDTSSFYNDEEMKYHIKIIQLQRLKVDVNELKRKKQKEYKKITYNETLEEQIKHLKSIEKLYNKMIDAEKEKLCFEFQKTREKNNKEGKIRSIRPEELCTKNIVSIFDSDLLRSFKIKPNTLSKDLIIVQTFYFEVIEDIIKDGFMCNNEKYIVFIASAGQIRVKKVVFIKESMYEKHKNTITCGLGIDEINSKGGMNINKYLAYLALCNSATDLWEDFDIDRTIVVDDMETLVPAKVDFINDISYTVERKNMNVPIPHMDGCGLISKAKSKKNFMFRMPWFKGLLAVFDFKKFIREMRENGYENCGIVKDIWGQEHDILAENIECIFTKSQFKMYKFYDNWEDYKTRFKKYNCHANKCNEEEDDILDATINYQMLQSLFIMTDEDIRKLTAKSRLEIDEIGRNPNAMLKALCATDDNKHMNCFQQAVNHYPSLLRDNHTRENIKNIKKSKIKDGRSGKLRVNGKYTFLIPDLYAFCEWLFLGEKNPKGLLEDGQVSCKLYKERKLDCLRSPHLYVEHAIRNNIHTKDTKKWFTTNGIYTSVHDIISKVLQFDNDGDKSLVVAEDIIIDNAEREIKEYDIVPLFYNMRKAEPQILDNKVLFEGMKLAWVGGNIGIYSNNISKIYNSEKMVSGTKQDRMECLKVIKLLCMENNFVIDYAKTLYKPVRPKWATDLITSFTKTKLPHFFAYAKDKDVTQIENINNSVVNNFVKEIPKTPIKFDFKNGESTLPKFYHTHLLCDKKFKLDENSQLIIDTYFDLCKKHKEFGKVEIEDGKKNPYNSFVYKNMASKMLELGFEVNYIVDTLVTSLYKNVLKNSTSEERNLYRKNTSQKDYLWYMFGDIILKKNRDKS